jgi:hypothetical protein
MIDTLREIAPLGMKPFLKALAWILVSNSGICEGTITLPVQTRGRRGGIINIAAV